MESILSGRVASPEAYAAGTLELDLRDGFSIGIVLSLSFERARELASPFLSSGLFVLLSMLSRAKIVQSECSIKRERSSLLRDIRD